MIRRDRLSSLIHHASAMSMLVAASVCAPSLPVLGQTVAVPYLVTSGGVGKPAAPMNFVAAPAFALGDIPSSAISADLNGDGKPDLIVASALTGEITVYLGSGQGRFANPAVYSAGGHPVSIAAADLRGSGRQDIVAANGTDKTVSVLFGLGDGKLGPAQVYASGIEADLIAVGSLKANAQPDIAVASTSGRSLTVLLNDGRGTLLAPLSQSLPRTPASLVLARLSASGNADLALANSDGTVSVLTGRGDGTFNSAALLNVSSSPLSLIVSGDFDRDGKADLAVAGPEGRLLTVLRGNGDGSFTRGASYPVGSDPVHALSIDVNGDGIPDLVTANRGSNTFSTLLGNGDGSFKAAVHSTVGNGPVALASGDFYGRGFTGLAVLNAFAKSVSVVEGNGDGSFKAATSYSGDLSPRSIVSGDLNGDGRADLVVANFCGSDATCARPGTLSIYLAKVSGGYTLASKLPVGAGPVAVALADLNGDKNLDAIALNRTGKSVSILLGLGDGTFAEPRTVALADSPAAFALGDFNRDGKTDLAVVTDCGAAKCAQPGAMTLLFGAGDGSFTSGRAYPVGYSPVSIAIADIDLDGSPDILVANRCGIDPACAAHGTASVFAGDGKGSFSARPDVALGNSPSSLALDSLTGGSISDLVVTNETDGTVAVFRGKGDGTFAAPSSYTAGSAPRSAVIANFSGGGSKSVAVANLKDSTVSLLTGRGDGTLLPAVPYSVGTGPESLAAVTTKSGTAASIVTANGSSSSAAPGLDITDLTHAVPEIVTTTISVTGSPYTYGTATPGDQLTVTLTPMTATTPAPTGTITLTDTSATPNATVCTISTFTSVMNGTSYTGSCAPSTPLTVGSHVISASYAGDAVYGSPMSTTYNQQVAQAPTSLALSNTPFVVNQTATVTATVTANPPGIVNPILGNGTVDFTITNTNGSTSTVSHKLNQNLTSTSTASIDISPVLPGSYTISATYSGDSSFVGPTTSSIQVTPGQAATTVVFTAESATVTYGQSITFTAMVSSTGTIQPSDGTISFTSAPSIPNPPQTPLQCSQSSNAVTGASTSVSCTVNPLTLTPYGYTITATYAPVSGGAFKSGSATTPLTVNKATPTLTISSSASATTPTYVNQPVTFTAAFTGLPASPASAPSLGTYTFTDTLHGQSTVLCAGSAAPTCTASMASAAVLHAGSNVVSVVYVGGADPNYGNSASVGAPTVTVGVTAGTTAVGLTQTPAPTPTTPTVDQQITLSAVVSQTSPSSPTTAIPISGTVAFTATPSTGATVPLCTVTLVPPSTTATCTTRALPVGTDTVTASYTSATADFGSSSSTTSPETVNAAASEIQYIQSIDNGVATQTSTVNDPVKFTAKVVANVASSTALPILPMGGLVKFTATYTNFAGVTQPAITFQCVESLTLSNSNGSAPITNGLATCTPTTGTNLQAGVYQVSAQYVTSNAYPDPNFNPSPVLGPIQQFVNQAVSSLTLSTAKSTSIATQAVTYTAKLTVPLATSGGGSVVPAKSELVTFAAGGGATVCPAAALVTNSQDSTSSAACAITFPNGTLDATAGNAFPVNASYIGDNNFTASAATPALQTVQDFSLTAPATNFPGSQTVTYQGAPAPILFVSQGYAIGTIPSGSNFVSDPMFNTAPSTTGVATETVLSGFGDTVMLTSCASGNTSAPTCTPVQSTVIPSNLMVPLTISAGTPANPTAPGDYVFRLNGADEAVSGLNRSTSDFTVTVVPVTTNQPVSVSAAETAKAQFAVPAPADTVDTFTFTCLMAMNLTTGKTTTYPLPSTLPSTEPNPLSCSPTAKSGPLTLAADGTFDTTFVVGNVVAASSQAQSRPAHPAATYFAATFIGIPFFAWIGWIGRKRYGTRTAIRLLGLAASIALISQAIGCGSSGGFTVPTNPAAAANFDPGVYLVRVSATDQNTKVVYYSTIQFTGLQAN